MLHKTILVFGEVLWDIFPDGKKLGGAPLNFSYYFQKQGGNVKLISAIGKDELGEEALKQIMSLGIKTSYIQKIDKPSGRVEVSLNKRGHIFNIIRGAAWEYIKYPKNPSLIENSYGLYFGALSRVSKQNRRSLDRLLEKCRDKLIFLDLNLRPGFYDLNDVKELIKKTTHLKLNKEEAIVLRNNRIIGGSTLEEMINNLINDYNLTSCCITLGDKGAIGWYNGQIIRVNGIPAKRGGDSVGTGDAFAATWLANLLEEKTMEEALYEANRIGSLVASQRGAIVKI